jgi:hypothetical protein
MALQRLAIVLGVVLVAVAAVYVGPAIARRDGERGPNDCSRDGRDSGGRRRSLQVIGLTADQRLICFDENDPDRATTIGQVTGLAGDTALIGIDFRPANNALYGAGNAGGIYTIDTSNATATRVAQLSVALAGGSFGVDVNPTADAFRVISDSGQNLRFSFAAGTTTVDGTLSYPPSMPPAAGVVGVAYTNNDADPNTATTLYTLDSILDQVAVQSPANSGQLAATGKLGVDAGAQAGFDAYSTIRDGSTVSVRALASLTAGGQSRLYAIALTTGAAELLGTFSQENQVIGIAILLAQL